MGVIEPDITPNELLKAGDIKQNPGPMNSDRCDLSEEAATLSNAINATNITKEKKTWTCKECMNGDGTSDTN